MRDRPANPKLLRGTASGHRDNWYSYYAGFSANFVADYLRMLRPRDARLLLDPWSGSGTALVEGLRAGVNAAGIDLNPAMVIVSKARLLHQSVVESLLPLALELTEAAPAVCASNDPLKMWFRTRSAGYWRSIEQSISRHLVPHHASDLAIPGNVSALSSLAAFYYVALFKALRRYTRPFASRNPTWVKVPKDHRRRVDPSWKRVSDTFIDEVSGLADLVSQNGFHSDRGLTGTVTLGDARALPIPSETVDLVISSPPYCTRIDYAVATLPELAVLGLDRGERFRKLRDSLTGSTTIRTLRPETDRNWGDVCMTVLDQVKAHPSQASRRYYLPQFVQYFSDLFIALGEIRRVLVQGGTAVLVVQDSLYKDVHIDLAAVVAEMALHHNLIVAARHDYVNGRSMRQLNLGVRRYVQHWRPTESALELVAA